MLKMWYIASSKSRSTNANKTKYLNKGEQKKIQLSSNCGVLKFPNLDFEGAMYHIFNILLGSIFIIITIISAAIQNKNCSTKLYRKK